MSSPSSVVLNDVSFSWPDGTPVLSHVSGAFARPRTGVVGVNGAGKSTLLKLIAGELQPGGGSVVTSGTVDHLRQNFTLGTSTLSDLLGITGVRDAVRAVEAGVTDPGVFDVIGDAWDIEEHAVAGLAALGLPTDLDRSVQTLRTAVPRGRRIAELRGVDGRGHVIQGPERVALIGANGVGKTTLVEALLPEVAVRTGYLPQRIVLDEAASVFDVVHRSAPNLAPAELRNRLARLLIRGAMIGRPVRSLSGGERLWIALARLLFAEPPVEFLVLDEPTNDLNI